MPNGTSRSSTRNGAATWSAPAIWTAAIARAACSTSTGHPGPARQRDQSGPAANILTLTSDKQEYRVGETAIVQLPEASQGRALLTLESGSAILEQRWLEAKPGANRVSIPITAGMAPGDLRRGHDGAAARRQDQ